MPVERDATGRVSAVVADSVEVLTFATLDDMLRHMEATAVASRNASERIERLTVVLVVLTVVLIVLTAILAADAIGLVNR